MIDVPVHDRLPSLRLGVGDRLVAGPLDHVGQRREGVGGGVHSGLFLDVFLDLLGHNEKIAHGLSPFKTNLPTD